MNDELTNVNSCSSAYKAMAPKKSITSPRPPLLSLKEAAPLVPPVPPLRSVMFRVASSEVFMVVFGEYASVETASPRYRISKDVLSFIMLLSSGTAWRL